MQVSERVPYLIGKTTQDQHSKHSCQCSEQSLNGISSGPTEVQDNNRSENVRTSVDSIEVKSDNEESDGKMMRRGKAVNDQGLEESEMMRGELGGSLNCFYSTGEEGF